MPHAEPQLQVLIYGHHQIHRFDRFLSLSYFFLTLLPFPLIHTSLSKLFLFKASLKHLQMMYQEEY